MEMTFVKQMHNVNEAPTSKTIDTFLAVKFMSHRAAEKMLSPSLHLENIGSTKLISFKKNEVRY